MTIKVGTRVRVQYEATVIGEEDSGGTYYAPPEEKLPGESGGFLHPSRFEVIAEPLRVGDVITADSPEPPIGTTLMDQNGESARRNGMGEWGVTWGGSRSWGELTANHFRSQPTWIVQRVGKGQA